MSIADNYVPVKELGNGSTTVFSGPWAVLNSSFIRVFLEDVTTGAQVLQALDSDYTLTFDDSGFEVDFSISSPPLSTKFVVISRVIAKTQTVPYKTSKGFQGAITEGSFDKVTAMIQDIDEGTSRAILLPIGSTSSTELPSPVALNIFGWNSDATAIVNYTLTDFPTDAEIVTTGLAEGDLLTWDATAGNWVNITGPTTFGYTLIQNATAADARADLDVPSTSEVRTPAVQSVVSSATVTPTSDNDLVNVTAQAEALDIANPTGTLVEGQALIIRIKDDGTSRAITYGTEYRALGVTLPTATIISKTLYLAMIWNDTDTKFDVTGVAQEA